VHTTGFLLWFAIQTERSAHFMLLHSQCSSVFILICLSAMQVTTFLEMVEFLAANSQWDFGVVFVNMLMIVVDGLHYCYNHFTASFLGHP